MLTPSALFATFLFTLIGAVAFGYGRRHASLPPMLIGMVIIVFPYFVSSVWLIYVAGFALCALLFQFRE